MKENDFNPRLFSGLLDGVDRRRHRQLAWTASDLKPLERFVLIVAYTLVFAGLAKLVLGFLR